MKVNLPLAFLVLLSYITTIKPNANKEICTMSYF